MYILSIWEQCRALFVKPLDMKILLYGFSESYARRAAECCDMDFCTSFEKMSGDCLLLQCPLLDDDERIAFFERMTGCDQPFDAVVVSGADAIVQYCSPQGKLFIVGEPEDPGQDCELSQIVRTLRGRIWAHEI